MNSDLLWAAACLLALALINFYFRAWLPIWDWWVHWFRYERKG